MSTLLQPEQLPLTSASTPSPFPSPVFSIDPKDTPQLERDVAHCIQAVDALTSAKTPIEQATAYADLGIALTRLGEQQTSSHTLEKAQDAYRATIDICTRNNLLQQLAAAQNNLGFVLRILGERENNYDRLNESITIHRQVLKTFIREREPHEWAVAQRNLGNALYSFGLHVEDTGILEEAALAYREALTECSHERAPTHWAQLQNSLGLVLSLIGERTEHQQPLEEAISAFIDSLEIRTRSQDPFDWAGIKNNLGWALVRLGYQKKSLRHLNEAIAIFQESSEEWTRDKYPLQWATIQTGIGAALVRIAELQRDLKFIYEAMIIFHDALDSLEAECPYADKIRLNLTRAESLLQRWPIKVVLSWKSFTEYAQQLCSDDDPNRPAFIWRGQTNAQWAVQSSLKRFLPTTVEFDVAIEIELALLHEFQQQAHHLLVPSALPRDDDVLSWWSFMQHYGAPTRFLDWSQSPYVAAYFAAADQLSIDAAVFAVHAYTLAEHFGQQYEHLTCELTPWLFRPDTPRTVVPFYGWRPPRREIVQKARYTFCTYTLEDHDIAITQLLSEPTNPERGGLIKVVFPGSLKPVFLAELNKLGINHETLFPIEITTDLVLSQIAENTKLIVRERYAHYWREPKVRVG